MPTKSRFCPLCDVLVDVWINPHDNLTVANPDYRLNWLQSVRALRTRRGLEEPFITGVGWLDIEGDVISPLEYDSSYHDYEPEQDLHHDFATHQVGYPQPIPVEYWCYVIHDACWELLRDRVDRRHRVSANNLARHLFALLFNTPINAESETLAPGHDYGHASQFHPRSRKLDNRYFTRVNSTSYSFITGDITEEFVPDEESLEDEVKFLQACFLPSPSVIHREYSEPDPFLLLPRELIVLVLIHLPSRDICNLRLASRYAADLSSPKLLDQMFWSSRFDPDFEMGFVFAGPSNPRPGEPADWRTLYLKVVQDPAVNAAPSTEKVDPIDIWNPSIPKVFPEWCFIPCPPQNFNLCLNMNFGGTNGGLLRSLTRIDAFMGKYRSVLTGILFSYIDGSERFYGRKSFRNNVNDLGETPAIRKGFPIDGPRGEVITKITVDHRANRIEAIAITTSLGREEQFRLYGRESTQGVEPNSYVLQAEPGMCFETFYAKIQSPLGHFQNFSAQCRPINLDTPLSSPEKLDVTHHIPLSSEILAPAEDMLTYPGGFAITTADLSRLRRIRVSVRNIKDVSSSRCITGLWLEYHDSTMPTIVGQWVEESGSFEIPPGDRISEVITWHDHANQHNEVKYGPLKKLKFRTTHGIIKEFEECHGGAEICLEYRENAYETLVSPTSYENCLESSILWGYNHEWDHIHAFYTPKVDKAGSRLLMGSASYSPPSWSVAQRVFMRDTYEDGSPNPVIGIQAKFRKVTGEIVGLCFIYEDGRSQTLGIGGTRPNRILYMNFLTTSGRKIEFSRASVERMSSRVLNRTIYILDRSYPDQHSVVGANLYQVPEGAGALAGFWAMPRRHEDLRYGRFGPIFESHNEDA
ncbi:hypothetical protein Daesc_006696 [Daldinia eschscholtzii]|uniref:F-box domain-containing protein n=1 Tax=Daldinia eschscholtzii TaxID=292717 RepID=A0AAX6MI85_9PEZI